MLVDGQLLSAVEEERLNRIKHWAGFPLLAIRHCTEGVEPTHVAVSRNPLAHLSRKIARVLASPRIWARSAHRAANVAVVSRAGAILRDHGLIGAKTRVHFIEHHRSHLSSAFFCSPFEEAAVLSVDAFGDFSSLMWGVGSGNRLDIRGSIQFPHSLGIFYSAFAQFLGMRGFGDEQKLMSLAAFGEPRFAAELREVVSARGDQVRLNLDYFVHSTSGVIETWNGCAPSVTTLFSKRMIEVFGSPRESGSEVLPQHADLAASVQAVLEEHYLSLLDHIQKHTRLEKLCLAGGVALNCVANGLIFDRTAFKHVFIQPAANDAGTSLGAALFVQHQILKQPRSFVMRHAYYGDEFSDAQIRQALGAAGLRVRELDLNDLIREAAALIAQGKVVGWFQGRMEFGPRALGNRSILADPRRPEMQEILNSRIKLRERFRPFCPSVLSECAAEYFETQHPSPFMTMAYKIKPRYRPCLPAVTHRDGTARLQTVDWDVNPTYWKIIRAFGDLTGVPILLNTSFNENEPIVHTPAEAIHCFQRTRMDALAIGSYLLQKTDPCE